MRGDDAGGRARMTRDRTKERVLRARRLNRDELMVGPMQIDSCGD